MKVKSIPAFWKLAEQHLDHLGSSGAFYFFIHPQEGERGRFKEQFLNHSILQKFTEVRVVDQIEQLLSELEWVPLFSEKTLYLLEGVQKLKKEQIEQLSKKKLQFQGAALFLLSELPTSSLFSSLDHQSLCLDLSEEKVWEKKKRIEEQIAEEMRSKKIQFTSEALALFLEALAPDYLGWKQELEKFSLFKGTNPITMKDLEVLFSPIQEQQFLQGKAQQFLKNGLFESDASFEDSGRWLQWVGALRSALEMGMGFCMGSSTKGRYYADFYEVIKKEWSMQSLQKVWLELFQFERHLKLFHASPHLLWQQTLARIDFLRYGP